MAQRSLDGLCLFPYLPDAEARKYLDAAGADPLVASLLIIRRRNMQFDYSSQTTKAAVEGRPQMCSGCSQAPRSAEVRERVEVRFNACYGSGQPVSFSTHKAGTLFFRAPKANESVEKIALDPVLLQKVYWDLAKTRYLEIQASPEVLPPTRAHMKRMLLAKIHGFYMEALGRLPKVELCCQSITVLARSKSRLSYR
jgi:hypothetical protein